MKNYKLLVTFLLGTFTSIASQAFTFSCIDTNFVRYTGEKNTRYVQTQYGFTQKRFLFDYQTIQKPVELLSTTLGTTGPLTQFNLIPEREDNNRTNFIVYLRGDINKQNSNTVMTGLVIIPHSVGGIFGPIVGTGFTPVSQIQCEIK